MAVFIQKALQSPGFLQKVFGRQPKENALAELNNALASTGNVQSVTFDTIEHLNLKYRTDVHAKFSKELRQLYSQFLLFCLEDRQFTEQEVTDLWHLKALFGIPDSEHEHLYRAAALQVYQVELESALRDSTLTDGEKSGLEHLSAYLQIPELVRKQTFDATAQQVLQSRVNHYAADNQLSPSEEAELYALARSLGASLTFDKDSTLALQKMRVMWQINNGQLPPVPVPIALPRGEECYLATDVNWYEARRVTRRVSYGGPSLRIKIAKGVYWNTGTYGVQRHSEDVLTRIDSGRVYLTNRRVIFDGAMKNQSIRLQKILDLTPYKDGVLLEKDTGKSPLLELDPCQDVRIFVALLARLIRDAQ